MLFFDYHQNGNSKIKKFCISRESVDSILGNAKLLCAPSDSANIYPPSDHNCCDSSHLPWAPSAPLATLLFFLHQTHLFVKLQIHICKWNIQLQLHKALRNKGSIHLAVTTFFNFISTLQFIIYNFFLLYVTLSFLLVTCIIGIYF